MEHLLAPLWRLDIARTLAKVFDPNLSISCSLSATDIASSGISPDIFGGFVAGIDRCSRIAGLDDRIRVPSVQRHSLPPGKKLRWASARGATFKFRLNLNHKPSAANPYAAKGVFISARRREGARGTMRRTDFGGSVCTVGDKVGPQMCASNSIGDLLLGLRPS